MQCVEQSGEKVFTERSCNIMTKCPGACLGLCGALASFAGVAMVLLEKVCHCGGKL